MRKHSTFGIGVVLLLLLGFRLISVQAEGRFSDVRPGAWYEKAVVQAQDRGLVGGFPDGTYRPEKTLTYAEYLTMLAKFISIEPEQSETGDHWAAGTVRALQNAGILDGATWRPEWIQAPIPREKAYVYALRALGIEPRDASFDFFVDAERLHDDDRGYVNTAYLEYLANGIGRDAATGERRFGAGQTLTRAQAAVILDQLFDFRADAQAYKQKKAAERAKEKIPGNDPNKTVWNATRTVKIGEKTITAQIVYVNPKSPRVKIQTALGSGAVGGTEAFAYVYPEERANGLMPIAFGDWKIAFGDWKVYRYLPEPKKEVPAGSATDRQADSSDTWLYFAYGSCMDDRRFAVPAGSSAKSIMSFYSINAEYSSFPMAVVRVG